MVYADGVHEPAVVGVALLRLLGLQAVQRDYFAAGYQLHTHFNLNVYSLSV